MLATEAKLKGDGAAPLPDPKDRGEGAGAVPFVFAAGAVGREAKGLAAPELDGAVLKEGKDGVVALGGLLSAGFGAPAPSRGAAVVVDGVGGNNGFGVLLEFAADDAGCVMDGAAGKEGNRGTDELGGFVVGGGAPELANGLLGRVVVWLA